MENLDDGGNYEMNCPRCRSEMKLVPKEYTPSLIKVRKHRLMVCLNCSAEKIKNNCSSSVDNLVTYEVSEAQIVG